MTVEKATRILSHFDINTAGELVVANKLVECLKPSKRSPGYFDNVLTEMAYCPTQDYPRYEVSKFDTIHGMPVVIELGDGEFKPVYVEED